MSVSPVAGEAQVRGADCNSGATTEADHVTASRQRRLARWVVRL